MKLHEIAHSRCGDKGNDVNISVIPYNPEDYLLIKKILTKEKVFKYFKELGCSSIERYECDNMKALNFVIRNVLAGGVNLSLRLDKHGKALSSFMLEIDI